MDPNNKCCICVNNMFIHRSNDGYYYCENSELCISRAENITNKMIKKLKCTICSNNLHIVDDLKLKCNNCSKIIKYSENELRKLWIDEANKVYK